MIIFRYLAREVLASMIAVTGVLLLIIMSGRFIKYLAKAAAGELSAGVLFSVILYRIPGFLELILPLGLFLGILLAYGRLYLESEMTVLTACGVSPRRLLVLSLPTALLVALLVAGLSLFVSPWGALKVEQIFTQQESVTEIDALSPRRFHSVGTSERVTYSEAWDDSSRRLQGVFVAEQVLRNGERQLAVLVAESGQQLVDPQTGSRFLLLENGARYEGVAGRADFRQVRFQEYGVKLSESPARQVVTPVESLGTDQLLGREDAEARAQLHWRLSLPVLCLVVTVLAVPLSKVNPRQGRFARLLPSILIYLCYLALLTSVRSAIEKGELDQVALWGVHLLFLAGALSLALAPRFWSGVGKRARYLQVYGRRG